MEPVTGPEPKASLRAPMLVLGAVVVTVIGLALASSLVVLVAFSALAAIVCRRLQLGLLRRSVPGWAAVTITVLAFVLVLALLGVAAVASVLALASRLGDDVGKVQQLFEDARSSFEQATGLPSTAAPALDAAAVVDALRRLVTTFAPGITALAMSVIIVAYLLIDATRLRGRMLRATSAGVMDRYDRLADELVTYVGVRAVLGAAAAVADTVLLLVLGVPFAILWGIVSFLFSFVPNLGFILALIPPTLLALVELGPVPALLVVVGYTVINLAFDYVLQPRMVASSLDLSPVVTIVSILVWTAVLGPAGALLAVPLTISMRSVLMPFPGARWFVALLGPVEGDRAAGSEDVATTGAAATTEATASGASTIEA